MRRVAVHRASAWRLPGRITVDLPGADNDQAVLASALRYATRERASLRIVLAKDRPADAFQDQLHHALLDLFVSLGRRPADIEVVTS